MTRSDAAKSTASVWLACTLACRPTPAPPVVAAPLPSRATTADRGVVITVLPYKDGARVVYELPEATDRVPLVRADSLRRDEWRVMIEGTRLVDDVLISDAPRESFEVVIPPDTVERDRVYPSLHRVAGGIAIFGPTLLVEGVDARVELRPGAGGVAIPERAPERGYAWLGPADAVIRGEGFRVVADESVAPWLVDHVRNETGTTLSYYANALGVPGREPTILVSMQNTMEGDHRGDASESDVISLRFFDPRWKAHDPGAAAMLAKFVRHEAFHLWNAHVAPSTPPWLHEGGAEYAAIVAAVDAGALTHAEGVEQLAFHLDRCRMALGPRPLAKAELSGSQVYWCGVALQWVADTEARADSASQRDTFTIWRDLLRRGEDGGYSLEDLRAVTGPTVAAMLDDEGPERWSRLASALAKHGATISEEADDRGWRAATLQHLLAEHCKGPHGFFTNADHVRLDAPADSCGPLGGDPEIVKVGGANIMTAPRKAFDAVRRSCDAKKKVELETKNGKTLRIACTRTLMAPVGWTLVAAPPLSRSKA